MLNEQAADRKIKKLLQYCAVMINLWIPKEKRTRYINYLYSYLTES